MCICTQKDLNTTNFFYAMSLSYLIGLDAAMIFGTGCTHHQSIDSSNANLVKLLEYTGMPSLEEMANCDAYSTIVQWQILHPHLFREGTRRQIELRRQNKLKLWVGVRKPYEKSLVGKMFEMAKAHAKYSASVSKSQKCDFLIRCQEAKAELGSSFSYRKWTRLIAVHSMADFGCLEGVDVLFGHKESISLKAYKENDEWKYVTHSKKRKDPDTSPEIQPLKFKVGRFSALMPIAEPDEIDNEKQVLDTDNKDTDDKKGRKDKKTRNDARRTNDADGSTPLRRLKRRRGKRKKNAQQLLTGPNDRGDDHPLGDLDNNLTSPLGSRVNSKKRDASHLDGESDNTLSKTARITGGNHTNLVLDQGTPRAVKYEVRKYFTPGMLNSWKIVCTVCGMDITNSRDHMMRECPKIRDSQVRIKDSKGKLITNRRRKRLFAIGQIHDTND